VAAAPLGPFIDAVPELAGPDLLPGRGARRRGRRAVHREAHGLVADEIHPVAEGH
jgi:hypothetical protein